MLVAASEQGSRPIRPESESNCCALPHYAYSGSVDVGAVVTAFVLAASRAHVAEGLEELAQELFADGINLLSEKADIVDEGSGPFEDGAGPRRCPARTGPAPARRCTDGP